VAATAIVDIMRQMLLSNKESTCGKSAIYPQATRPIVFVIPIMDSRNDAELLSIPLKEKKKEKTMSLNGIR